MCGITGVFFLKGNKNLNLSSIEEMTSSLTHRGPDNIGIFECSQENLKNGLNIELGGYTF